MIIALIVAMDEKGGIGKDNRLPWHLPSDLKRFKQLTMGHYIVMGRKTYETIGRPLVGRETVIITHQKNYTARGCTVVHSLTDALQVAEHNKESEVFIIGGGEIFPQAIDLADKIYLTTVHTDAKADVHISPIDTRQWSVVFTEPTPKNDQDDFTSDFTILLRKKSL